MPKKIPTVEVDAKVGVRLYFPLLKESFILRLARIEQGLGHGINGVSICSNKKTRKAKAVETQNGILCFTEMTLAEAQRLFDKQFHKTSKGLK